MTRILLALFLCITCSAFGQETTGATIDVNYFYGTILRHNKDIAHLIKGHPDGFIASYNTQTFGKNRWEQAFNYPEYGYSILYHNSHNPELGNTIGVLGHYNFYFLNRNVMLRLAQGISYTNNPFDLNDNPKNNAYGSHLLATTYILLNYQKKNIFKGFGVQAGLTFIHNSNANFKAPNSSTNTVGVNLGVTYELDGGLEKEFVENDTFGKVTTPIHLNFMVRGGVNESDFLGLGQKPFYILTAFAEKRLNFKSSIQLGTEVFFSKFLESEIDYIAAAFPSRGITGDEDYKRVGVFAGHELHINKLSFITQLGYYVYYPYDFEGRVYLRPGLKYHISEKLFTEVSLKTHGAKAEALEFGVGFRIL
ncbi:MAG: acyloxyacyl hydrolase [Patiriisocius sp.]|uniref:acyloxyacyl hydrolase n=1 Tax=Patiriisocius sp. TaxID=2822396 RepID=UPI003EF5E8CE